MSNDIVLFEKIDELEARVKELEGELLLKDEVHLEDLRCVRDCCKQVMDKYHLR